LELPYIFILLTTGAAVGFLSSLLGVGGAFILTPVQFAIYLHLGLSEDIAILTSFGTSLMVALPTAISGTWQHHRNKTVYWKPAIVIGITSMAFSAGGATLAQHLPGAFLKVAFGVILILVAIRLLLDKEQKDGREPVNKPLIWAVWAVPVGLASGLFGIGGGVVLVPVLVLALKFEIRNAIGTSLAVVIFTSVGGIIGYVVNGIGVPDRLPYSIGYVNLTSWLILAVPAVLMAQLGAFTTRRVPRRLLTYVFIAILAYFGLRMIGFFEWLGISI
jgi:uncharacterized membrane protein YfcA